VASESGKISVHREGTKRKIFETQRKTEEAEMNGFQRCSAHPNYGDSGDHGVPGKPGFGLLGGITAILAIPHSPSVCSVPLCFKGLVLLL
jgi:hypothetical protein